MSATKVNGSLQINRSEGEKEEGEELMDDITLGQKSTTLMAPP